MRVGGSIYPGRVQQSEIYYHISFEFKNGNDILYKESRRVTLGGLELETEHQVTMLADAHHLSRQGLC